MERSQKLNQGNLEHFISLCRMISEIDFLGSEISEMVRNNEAKDGESLKEKYEIFFDKHSNASKQLKNNLSLANNLSTIFEADINALAVEKIILNKKSRIHPVGKKYSKLRIHYKVIDNGCYKGRGVSIRAYRSFGILLICSLSHNSRIFNLEIARMEKNCDKTWSCDISLENATIVSENRNYLSFQSKELKFLSLDKLSDILNICETTTVLINSKLEKLNLEKLTSNFKIR